ncbi:alpha/beta fold hydrolase [Paracoccaceae bacterium]
MLIHGAGHGAWAWEAVIPALSGFGHSARAIDLPGRGGTAATLAAQAGAIVAALRGPTVLVGHSAGGFAITAAALASAQVTRLIYLCAFIPQPGRSIADLRRACPEIGLRGSYRISADRQSFAFDPAKAKSLFFHDCPDPAGAAARMCAEPVAPQETALERLPELPRAAILCSEDRAIPLAYQQKMAMGISVQRELPCGHSPFLSMPRDLAATLDVLSRR